MEPQMQNPGVQAGVSRDPIGIRSHHSLTAPGWRWQLIATRYRLPAALAKEVARNCYGEGRNEH